MIIGVDFDGTVVTHEYPYIGEDIGAVPVLKRLVEAGHKLILFTMRSSKNGTLQDAVNWFKENNIPLYGVNTNPTQSEWTDSPKAHCNVYIDDAGFGMPVKFDSESRRRYVDWEKLESMLEEEGILESENNDNMRKVQITESVLRSIIEESVKRILESTDEKAVSKAQQRFFGMVHAYQNGDMPNASKSIKDAADSMTDDEVEDFASTKHKGLPNHVKKSKKK